MSKKIRVGINGFGRIGRLLFRCGFDRVDIVGVNNGSGSLSAMSHFLKYDSTHGRFQYKVDFDEKNLLVNDKKIPMSFKKDPGKIPWKDWGVDIVFECTGAFKSREDNKKHIQGGAKKVLVSAPAKVDATFVYGINHKNYKPDDHHIVSNASCTTNCLAPMVKVLNDGFGIQSALMTTVHSYTNDQKVLDSTHGDLRRARAAAVSMIPTSTGAAEALAQVLPELSDKIQGLAIRVPTFNVSLVDLTARISQPATTDQINEVFVRASLGPLKGVLACIEDPVVSIDMNGVRESSIIDLSHTRVVGEKMVKLLSWYDNEVGFSCRMLDLAEYMASRGL